MKDQAVKMQAKDRDRRYWEKNASRYDRSLLFFGRPMAQMIDLVGNATRGLDAVLEVAAGTGLVTRAIARAAKNVIATDYSPAMMDMLRERVREEGYSNVSCEQADIYALDFEPGSFDAVVAANVLHLLPDLPGALSAFRKLLKPGGRLIAPTFCHDETRLSKVASKALALLGFPGQRRFSSRSLRQALESAGLKVTRAETLPGLLPIGYIEGRFEAEGSP